MTDYKILIVEDDPVIQKELEHLLQGKGYSTLIVKDFSATPDLVREQIPHLILLDIQLPGISGFSLCSHIRSFSQVPIVFLTSSTTEMDELNSIMLGGDAFITKPYHSAILLAKISSLLHRVYGQSTTLSYKEVTLHLENSSLTFQHQRVELTKNELKLLFYLFEHAGSICSRNDLIDFLWDNQIYIDDNALSVNITRIRNKLKQIDLHNFIQTKHRQGYII